MKQNLTIGLLILILIAVIAPQFTSEVEVLGSSTCNNGNCTDFDAVDVTAGYYVDGASVINGSGAFVGTISSTNAATVGTFTQGGGIRATSTGNSTATLLVTDFDVENVVDYTLNTQDATLTLPATSTMTAIAPTAGDMRTIWIRNATTTAGIDLTIAAGTGMTFKLSASSTAQLIGDTDGDNTMRIDFVRKTDTDFNVYLTRYQD